jgi:hypothetical protein
MIETARLPLRGLSLLLVAALAVLAGCGTVRRFVRLPRVPFLSKPAASSRTAPERPLGFFARRATQRFIKGAIKAYGGARNWRETEGLELDMVWKTVEGGRVVEDPALVQMAVGSPPRIRIYYSKIDQTFALGDRGAWAMMRQQPDRTPTLVDRARYTAVIMNFFLSLPFNLTDRGVVVRRLETKIWGGQTYDTLTLGFDKGAYPWRGDTMTLWFRRPTTVLERCLFISTAVGSAFGPPPNSLWITWENHVSLNGIPLPRRWSFFRAEADGAMKEKLFDIEVTNAAGNRSFLPVLFREPVIEPPIPRMPITIEKTAPPLVTPTP